MDIPSSPRPYHFERFDGPDLPPHEFYEVRFRLPAISTLRDFVDALLTSTALHKIAGRKPLLADGSAAIVEGRGFLFPGLIPPPLDELTGQAGDAVALVAEGVIGMPFEVFSAVAELRFIDRPIFMTCMARAGADGRPGEFLSLLNKNADGTDTPFVHAYVAYADGDARLFADAGKTVPMPEDNGIGGFRFLCWLLMLLAHEQVQVRRFEPPVKLNKARQKRRRPPIPSTWNVRLPDSWITGIAPAKRRSGPTERRGGHHRSPTPHDRRGHSRRLPTGRMVWVRPTRVGALVRHLTRRRDFYEIEGGQRS